MDSNNNNSNILRYAVIEDVNVYTNGIITEVITNVVTNITISSQEHGSQQSNWVECPESVTIGMLWMGGTTFLPAPPKPRNIQGEWYAVRMKRNSLLAESDVQTFVDRWNSMTPSQQTDWSTYRQQLRDIPTTYSDPADVVWPTAPTSSS